MNGIKTTLLYKKLKKLDKELASCVLENTNNILELINKKTTINFPNFTNHDATHSINIINTMYELISDKIDKFNALELTLMIYSAMYHDIGMALDDEEIRNIKSNKSKYLYGKDFNSLKVNCNNDETLVLQEIIRVSHGKIANNLITTKYKEYFKLPSINIYFDEDLGKICQAHVEDKNYIENLSTDRTKGQYQFNTKFISILLRISDILDIDTTRTPLELYNSIKLSNYSDEEWQKNFAIDNTKKIFTKNKLKYIKIEGSCNNIKVHRKLLEYIKWIENELKIAIDITSNMNEKYHIELNTQVTNLIEPDGYTIPDLKLNMDYQAVTQLLMGESIYGSKKMGLRELIQNSIDTCMVKKEKLQLENIKTKDSYIPTIDINIDKKKNIITIEDNGMGMNEYIIKTYFLNVGKSYYKSKDFLDYKHNYIPIGNFGIGFLSCFMLSPEVKVITKYFGENYKYEIDVEQNSEYISFNKETESIWESGTKIVLSLEHFKNAFINGNRDEEIEKFISTNILIDDFIIRFNNNKIKINQKVKEATYKIDLSKYCKDIDGFIYLNETLNNNQIIEDIESAQESYYFDGNTFKQINTINDLNLNKLVKDNEIEYLKIPLLENYQNKKIKAVIDNGSDLYFENIIPKYKFKILFISNSFEFETPMYDDTIIFDNYFEITNQTENEYVFNELDIDTIKDNIKILNKYELVAGIRRLKKLLFSDNNNLFFNKRSIRSYSWSSCNSVYIKRIFLQQEYKFNLLDKITIVDAVINIKNNNLIPNISREKLISESSKLLEDMFGEVISSYALEHFKLSLEEKELVQKFINNFYPVKSILLK